MPDPPITKVAVPPFLSLSDRTALPIFQLDRRETLNKRLEQLFYNKIVQRKSHDYQTALVKGLGVYEMDIPARKLLLPAYANYVAFLKSKVDYAHFRVVWQGMRSVQWVLLSVPIGHTHSASAYEYCDENKIERPLPESSKLKSKTVETKKYVPKTKRARDLYVIDRKAQLARAKEKLAEMEAEKKSLEEEIKELSGQ